VSTQPSLKEVVRMKLHGNAARSLNRRRVLVRRVVEEEWSLTKAAEAAEVSEPTARKWAARYLVEGEAGLLDRPSAAHHVHNRTPEDRIGVICALRRLRMTAAEIAEVLEMPEATVSDILPRSGLGRLGRLGIEPPRRYERSRPGELVHIDAKKLGRIQRGAGHRITGQQHYNPTRGSRGQAKAHGRLGIRSCLPRRRHSLRLRRGLRRRAGDDRGRLPAPRDPFLRPPSRHRREAAHRQTAPPIAGRSTRSPAGRSG
jgi:transposase